jgi:hypothetical protein
MQVAEIHMALIELHSECLTIVQRSMNNNYTLFRDCLFCVIYAEYYATDTVPEGPEFLKENKVSSS